MATIYVVLKTTPNYEESPATTEVAGVAASWEGVHHIKDRIDHWIYDVEVLEEELLD